MICFDSSFLADYLRGHEYTRGFIEAHDGTAFFTTSVVLFELGYGALKHPSPSETLRAVNENLDWLRVEGFDADAAREAATIQDELRSEGAVLSVPDVLIAGSVRAVDGTLVTGDGDFERVNGLDVRHVNR